MDQIKNGPKKTTPVGQDRTRRGPDPTSAAQKRPPVPARPPRAASPQGPQLPPRTAPPSSQRPQNPARPASSTSPQRPQVPARPPRQLPQQPTSSTISRPAPALPQQQQQPAQPYGPTSYSYAQQQQPAQPYGPTSYSYAQQNPQPRAGQDQVRSGENREKKKKQQPPQSSPVSMPSMGGDTHAVFTAMMNCVFGDFSVPLTVSPSRTVFLNGKPMGNINDHLPLANIPTFGRCKTPTNPATAAATAAAMGTPTPAPCVPATTTPWILGKMNVLVQNMPALMKSSYCMCQWGGAITLKTDGQGGLGCMGVIKQARLPVPTVPHEPKNPLNLTDLSTRPGATSLLEEVLRKLRANIRITDPNELAEYNRLNNVIMNRCKDMSMSERMRLNELIAELPNNLTFLEKVAIAQRNMALEKAYGIRKGKPMTIQEADLQKANPHYNKYAVEYKQDRNGSYYHDRLSGNKIPLDWSRFHDAAWYSNNGARPGDFKMDGNQLVAFYDVPPIPGNPNTPFQGWLPVERYRHDPDPDWGYGINCATCSTAYAMRLRGFDVTAKSNEKGTRVEWLSEHNSFGIWENIDGSEAKPSITYDWMVEHNLKEMTPNDYKQYLDETCQEDGVYILTLGWNDGGGHATVLQRENGQLFHIEPQVDDGPRDADGRRSIDDLVNRLSKDPLPESFWKDNNGELQRSEFNNNPVVTQRGVMRVDNKLLKTTDNGFKDIFDFN